MTEEEMVAELSDLLGTDSDRFTEWEAEFIEDMERKIAKDYELTEGQLSKLYQIYEERA